jgi:hypothetical protein
MLIRILFVFAEKKTRPLKSSPETLALLEIEREKLQL